MPCQTIFEQIPEVQITVVNDQKLQVLIEGRSVDPILMTCIILTGRNEERLARRRRGGAYTSCRAEVQTYKGSWA